MTKRTTGTNNIAIGYQAMGQVTTGSLNVAIGKGALRVKPFVLTREQRRLEREALKFVLGIREERRVNDCWCYVASLWPITSPYGKITRDSVREALMFELATRDIDTMEVRLRTEIVEKLDRWIEDHIELIGKAAFSSGE